MTFRGPVFGTEDATRENPAVLPPSSHPHSHCDSSSATPVITAAMKVHHRAGPRLAGESPYVACLQYELTASRHIRSLKLNLACPCVYRGVKLDLGYRMDSGRWRTWCRRNQVRRRACHPCPIRPNILSYLKLSGKSLGLLINFNVVHLKDGIRRFVNGTGWK